MPGGIELPCSWEEINADRGSLKFERVKYGHESRGTQTRERQRWRGPAATVNYRSILHHLVREGAPHQQTRKCLKMIKREEEKLVTCPRWVPETKTDWPTNRRS
jgi:hypothetical protein